MPTRTYLTTPPGREPSDAPGRSASEDRERYVPGLGVPREPTPPSRWRAPLLVLAGIAIAALVLLAVLRVSAGSQAQDPALEPSLIPAPADEGPSLRDGLGGEATEDGATEDGAAEDEAEADPPDG